MTRPVTDYYFSQKNSDAADNGGALSDNTVPRNSLANVFPHVSGSERTSGIERFRKIWEKKLSGTATLVKAFLDRISSGGDRIQIKTGGYEDTQALADDIGWTDTITWTSGTRQCVTSGSHPEIAVMELVLFTTSGGAFRGIATVASWINTTTFTISAMIRGGDPVTGDTVRTFWIGSGDLNTALTGGSSTTIVADFEAAEGVYVGMLIALVDWDNLVDGQRSVEFCTVTGVSWAGTQATITVAAAVGSDHPVKTRGAVEGTESENFDVNGLTLLVSINGATYQTVTLSGSGRTAAQVVDQINAVLSGGTAYVHDTDKVGIRTNDYYAENSVQLSASSTALTELGLDSLVHNGTSGTVVAGVLELGTLAASHSTPIKTSASGIFTNNIVDNDIGAVYDDWEVLFTSATGFTMTGTRKGVIGSGNTAAAFKVTNPGNGSDYFEIPASCWGGTWAPGDKVNFTTYPAAKPIWCRETVGAGCAAAALNRAHLSSYASW